MSDISDIAKWHRKMDLELCNRGDGSALAGRQMSSCPHGKFAAILEKSLVTPATQKCKKLDMIPYSQEMLWAAIFHFIPSFQRAVEKGVYLNQSSVVDDAIVEWARSARGDGVDQDDSYALSILLSARADLSTGQFNFMKTGPLE